MKVMKDATEVKPNKISTKRITNKPITKSREFTDDERREKLKNDLQGFWEYRCKTHKAGKAGNEADTFTNNVVMRGGVISIVVTNNGWAGLSAEITGHRLWAKKVSETNPSPLPERLIWNATGGVIINDVKIQFTYSSSDRLGAGLTTDTFYVESEESGFELSPGKFTHIREDGKQVKGDVELRKMTLSNELKWAPKKVRFIPR